MEKEDGPVLRVGDFIYCKDRDDEVKTMYDLHDRGIETDFYHDDPDEPYTLQVVSVETTKGGR